MTTAIDTLIRSATFGRVMSQPSRISPDAESAVAAYLTAKADATRAGAALYVAARRAIVALRDDGLNMSAACDALGISRARGYQLLDGVPESRVS